MEIAYYSTANFIRHQGNLVDLTEYRRKLAQAQGGREEETPQAKASAPARRAKRKGLAPLVGDYCASAAIVVMAVTFVVKMMAVL